MAQRKRDHWLVLKLGMILGAAACYGQTAIADEVLSPLVATPIAAPNPLLGADDKTHLVYEIVLINIGATRVGLEKIETLDAISGTVLSTVEGQALAQMLRLNAGWCPGDAARLTATNRGATLPINGAIHAPLRAHVAERYGIDFVQLNDKNMLYSGPQDQLSSYAFFGDQIHSVADGIVVQIADSLPEQVDGPSPLLSNGLSYVFTGFEGQGVLRDEKQLFTGGEVDIDKSALIGAHKNQLPLNDEVMSFP